MKKLIVIFIIVITSLGFVKGQINMSSNGNVGIGVVPQTSYFLQVTAVSNNNGVFINTPSSTVGSNVYGLMSNFGNSTSGSINRALYGSVYNATATDAGQAYGVIGLAGNCTNGYNFGVFGQLMGTKSGASILGYVGSSFSSPSDLSVVGTQYAGYFMGNVKITGSIWAASGTITGSDERIKKEISELDSSDKIFNLKPKKYKLKSPKELLTIFKTTSDTAKVATDIKPVSDEYTKLHYGFLAQDLQQVYPDLVYTSPDGTLGIDYQGLIPMIIDQLQNMKKSLKEKDDRIVALEDGLEKCCGSAHLKNAAIDNNSGSVLTASLSQNTPNPFSTTTTIACYIPETVVKAMINIYDMNGHQLKSFPISTRGNDSIIINGNEFKAGMYLYTLIADSKEIDTKRMILTE